MNTDALSDAYTQLFTTLMKFCLIALVICVILSFVKSFFKFIFSPPKASKKNNSTSLFDLIALLCKETKKQRNSNITSSKSQWNHSTTSNVPYARSLEDEATFRGRIGEGLSETELYRVNDTGRTGISIRNLYISKKDGSTTEIDLVYVTTKGIFVIESKNYSGWIFGDENSQMWTVCFPNNKKYRFYNPIKQNNTHVKWLAKYLNMQIPMYSITVFSDECELKQISINHAYNFVIQRNGLFQCVCSIWDQMQPCMSEHQVIEVSNQLKRLANVDLSVRDNHIRNIQNKR